MDILFKIRIEHMLQHSGVAMVVFRYHQNETISPLANLREFGILNLLARIIGRKSQVANINELCFNALALLHFAVNKLSDIFASASLAHCTKDHRNEEWSISHRLRYLPR